MGNQLVGGIVTVSLAIIGVAIVAALVSNRAQTAQVISSAASGFGGVLGVALSPVSDNNYSPTSFTGGGAGNIMHF